MKRAKCNLGCLGVWDPRRMGLGGWVGVRGISTGWVSTMHIEWIDCFLSFPVAQPISYIDQKLVSLFFDCTPNGNAKDLQTVMVVLARFGWAAYVFRQGACKVQLVWCDHQHQPQHVAPLHLQFLLATAGPHAHCRPCTSVRRRHSFGTT